MHCKVVIAGLGIFVFFKWQIKKLQLLQIQKLFYSSQLILAMLLSSLQSCNFRMKWLLTKSVIPEMTKLNIRRYWRKREIIACVWKVWVNFKETSLQFAVVAQRQRWPRVQFVSRGCLLWGWFQAPTWDKPPWRCWLRQWRSSAGKPCCWSSVLRNWVPCFDSLMCIPVYFTWHHCAWIKMVRTSINFSSEKNMEVFYQFWFSLIAKFLSGFFFSYCSLSSFSYNTKFTAPDIKMTKIWITFLLLFLSVTMVSLMNF